MIPDRGPDSVIRHDAGRDPEPPPPFVVDWTQWGDACRFLARRIAWRAELDDLPFTGLVVAGHAGNVLAATLAAITGLPVVEPWRVGRLVFCTGVHRDQPAGHDAIRAAVVTHRHPVPVGCQWYFAIAPGRRVIWPWQV